MPRARPAAPLDRPAARLGLLALLLAGFGWLRWTSGHYGFWFDEYATLIFADQPLSHLWGGWMVRETNPPLFYAMAKGWQALGFHTVEQLRLLPELGGLAGLILLAWAAWLGWGWRAAVPAVVLAGLSAQHVHASQLLRGYIYAADGVTLGCVGLLLVLRAGFDRPFAARGWGWACYVAGSALAIYCHTTMLLWPVVATLALPCAAGRQWWPALREVITANCVVALVAGWWLWITLQQIRLHSGNIAWIPPLTPRDYAWTVSQSVLLARVTAGGSRVVNKVIALALLAGVVVAWRQPAARLVLTCLILGVLFQGAAALVQPIATQATLFWLSTFVVLLLAGAIGSLRPAWAGVAALLVLAGVLAWNLARNLPAQNEGDFARALRAAQARPGTGLLVEHAGMGAVTAKACAVAWPQRPCPVPLFVLASPVRTDSWAAELGPQPIQPARLQDALAGVRQVLTLRSADYDPALRFGLAPPSGVPNRPYLEGPFATDRFGLPAYSPPRAR